METRTFWLSFVDPDRPKGQRNLGAAVVDVTEDDAEAEKGELAAKCPQHMEGAEWIAAASRKAWQTGCNPGGEMASMDITGIEPPRELPKYQLLSREEWQRRGLM